MKTEADDVLVESYDKLLSLFKLIAFGQCDDHKPPIELARSFFDALSARLNVSHIAEKTPSSILFPHILAGLSPATTFVCVREPTAFLRSCAARASSQLEQERAGFDLDISQHINQLLFYAASIRQLLVSESAYLINSEALAKSPRTAASFIYGLVMGRPASLGTINAFNSIVGSTTEERGVSSLDLLKPYQDFPVLFEELGYPPPHELVTLDHSMREVAEVEFLYGITPTDGSWLQAEELFQVRLQRVESSFLVLELLAMTDQSHIDAFQANATTLFDSLPVSFVFTDSKCTLTISLASLDPNEIHLITLSAPSLISEYLTGHCSEALTYNIITGSRLQQKFCRDRC